MKWVRHIVILCNVMSACRTRQPSAQEEITSPSTVSSATTLSNPAPITSAISQDTLNHYPVRVGGPWVRCYSNFKPSGVPTVDLMHLTLMCGPVNGMQRYGNTLEGTISEGKPYTTDTIHLRQDACYRWFAVSNENITNLNLSVRDAQGNILGTDHSEDSWPIVNPDRPICLLEERNVTVEISSPIGSGAFAMELWELPPPQYPPQH